MTFVTRASAYKLIDVLFAYGINPTFKMNNLKQYGENIDVVVKGMTTPWDELSESEQKLAQESYQGMKASLDRGLSNMFASALSRETVSKLQIVPSLAHVFFGLKAAMKQKYTTKTAMKNPLFRGGCLVPPDKDESNSLDNVWITKSVTATKNAPMTKQRIPNWYALAPVSPVNATGESANVFVSLPHAVALFFIRLKRMWTTLRSIKLCET